MNHPARALTPTAVAALLVDTEPYLSCDGCFDRLDAHAERLLADPAHHDARMEAHLAGCGACAEEAAALLELLRGTELSPGAR
jgi:hypothetical protein